jgi:hypothetical protein
MASDQSKEPIGTDDAIILMFLSLIEEDGIEVDVTLNISGAVVSGTLIGPSAYYEGIIESFKKLEDNTMSKILNKKFNDLKEAYSNQKQEQDEKDDKENSATFIHLKKARYLNTYGQPITNRTTWWRGRISSIDGFSFNSLV